MLITQAIILGILQGITEFVPVSSSGHLILLPFLAGWESFGLAFDTILHVSTLFAIIIVFWKRIFVLLRGLFLPHRYKRDASLVLTLVIASIPAAAVGYYFGDIIEFTLHSPYVVVLGLLFGSLCMWIADSVIKKRRFNIKKVDNIGPIHGLLVGLAQVLSLVPGVSRSGITMSTGVWLGLNRKTSAEFSFLMGAPIFLGAGVYQITKLLKEPDGISVLFGAPMIAGFIIALVVGIVVIRFLLRYLTTNTFKVFIWYRVVLAAVVVGLVMYSANNITFG